MPIKHQMSAHYALTLIANLALLLAGSSATIASTTGEEGVLFVDDDASANGDGATWETAYRFLQDALIFATDPRNNISEIRVGQGSYKPDRDESNPDGSGDREATFNLVDGVALLGGYAGLGAEDPDARDIELYEAILSGDLLGDDGDHFANNEENSNNVAVLTDSGDATLLEGFTISGGNGGYGAGAYVDGGSPTIARCRFENNSAEAIGGGLLWSGDRCNLIECVFIGNRTFGEGGGMLFKVGEAEITDCHFERNSAERGGAVLDASSGLITFLSCEFIDNTATVGPGAIQTISETLIVDCQFISNSSALSAGAVVCTEFSLFVSCTFDANTAQGAGAIIHNGSDELVLLDCSFTNNEATNGEAGAVHSKDVSMWHCEFVGNHSTTEGGALWLLAAADIEACTFIDNQAESAGGAVYAFANPLTLDACQFVGNSAPDGGALYLNENLEEVVVDNCDFEANVAENGGAIYCASVDLLDLDADFDDNVATQFGGAVYAVDSEIIMDRCDAVGNTALAGGAVFADSDTVLTIEESEFAENTAIEDGGAIFADDQTVVTIEESGFSDNMAVEDGGAVWSQGDALTIIDSSFDENSARHGGAVYSFLSPVTIVDRCAFNANTAMESGGGISTGISEIVDSSFTDNTAFLGGGVATGDDAIVRNCSFVANDAVLGGGIFGAGHLTMTDCLLDANTAQEGAGLSLKGGPLLVDRCTFQGNLSQEEGGAICIEAFGDSFIGNCLLLNNAAVRGGALYLDNLGEMLITNCTMFGNQATEQGGAMYVDDDDPFDLANSILWNNSPDQIFEENGEAVAVRYSNIQNGWPGDGNIDVAPLFVDARKGDYRLAAGSPCIDAADNNALPADITLDLDGNDRFVNDFTTRDTGLGAPPIVDMGAYEFQIKGCPWDLDGDDTVDSTDLIILLATWGPCDNCDVCLADVHHDCVVNGVDLLNLLGGWGPCP